MKLRFTSLLLGLALTVCGMSGSQEAVATQSAMYSPQEYIPINGTCTMDLSPDQAVIAGGVSTAALKPTDAVDQLDKELGLMRTYIAEKHGEIHMMERVRSLKNPQPGRAETEPPFQVIQRLEITLPADAPVDPILEKLIELGFDRFGDNVLNDYNRREAVVRYRISNFDAKMKDFQQQCTVNAWKQWCSASSVNGTCDSQTPPSDLELQQFTVRSKETMMRPDGNSVMWQLVFTRAQRPSEPADLVGNVTVHLEGNIAFGYRRVAERP